MAYPEFFNLLMETPLDPRLEVLVGQVRNQPIDHIPDDEWFCQMRAALREVMADRRGPAPADPVLTPSFHGKDCLGNGEHEGIECCCDECDYYLICWPDWREL